MTDQPSPKNVSPAPSGNIARTEGKAGGASEGPLQTAHWTTMFLGLLGLLVLCPFVQWLELGSTESQSFSAIGVPPFAVVILCGLVGAACLAGLLKKINPRADFVMLYAMFSVGTLVCSSGLVRPIYGHITCLMDELIVRKVQTVAPGYNQQNELFFPKLRTPLMTEEQAATQALQRDVQYAALIEFTNKLRRVPRDVAPIANHSEKRYDLTGKGGFASTMTRLDWWWRERFKRDIFGGIKKDVDAWKDIQAGATTQASGSTAGYPQATIDRVKADPPGGFAIWFSGAFLGDVQAQHERLVVRDGVVEKQTETRTIPWSLWVWPIVNWTTFSLMVIGLLTCLAEVLRRIWLRIENLPMPLVEVPNGVMALLPGGGKSGSALGATWVMTLGGILIGGAWVSVQAAGHFKLPGMEAVPAMLGRTDMSAMLADYPWKFIGGTWLYWSPLLICVGLLVSLEVSRSVWSMTWICNLGLVVLGVIGISSATVPPPEQVRTFTYREYPFWDDQMAGAMMAMALWLLWASRKRLVDILAGAFRETDKTKLGDPLISPRVLPILLIVLLIAIPAYAWFMGVTSVKFLAVIFGVFILFSISAARLRAETGFLIVPAMPTMSRYNLMLGGASEFGGQASSVGASFFWLSNSLISVLLPQQLEIIALAQRQRVSLRKIGLAMMLAAVVALGIGMPFLLFWQYSQGVSPQGAGMAGGKDAMYIFYRFAGKNLDQGKFETVRLVATGIGAAIMFVLLFCRSKFLSFPIHPIGFVVTAAFSTGQYFNPQANVNFIWGPMLIAWLLKSGIYKIGGTELFARLLPLIRGVIVGHLVAIVVWAVVRQVFMDSPAPLFFTW